MEDSYTEEDLRKFLSEEKKKEIASTGRTCLNIFCVTPDGRVLISDMETTEDYVLQDRDWYKALMSAPRDEEYISSDSGSAVTESRDGGIIFGNCTENDRYLLLKISRLELYKDAYMQFILNSVIIIALVAVIAIFYLMGYKERCRAEDALKYRNRFISKMSGEFRTPLNKIAEYADSIKNSGKVAETADVIRLEAVHLGEMMDNILCYSDIVSRNENRSEPEPKKKHSFLTDRGQRFFRTLIIIMLVVTMLTTILLCSHLYIRSAGSKMLEEAGEYSYQINNWVTEQESIMNMFVNSISANPAMLDDYNGMVKYLDEITRHYTGISATYIANPDFTHGHPMVMNNGWYPLRTTT